MLPPKKSEEKTPLFQKLAVFIPVWVQVIICLGGVITAIVGVGAPIVIQRFFPTATPNLPSPAVATSIPETPSPESMSVFSTNTPAPLPGQDWAENCISSDIWDVYLAGDNSSAQSQCHQLAGWGITADQGRLTFASHHSQAAGVEYGLTTAWNNRWRSVDFCVDVKRQENSEIWVGFFEGDTPKSKGMVFVIQPGDVVDLRELPSGRPLVDNVYLPYAGGKFHPRINFEGGNIAIVVDGQGIASSWPVKFIVHKIFVGFRSLPNTNLNASISNLNFGP